MKLFNKLGIIAVMALFVSASATGQGRGMPTNGLTMDQVEQRYGAPAEKISPVGQPPIARWQYAGFTVYFEHRLVLHSVSQG